MVVLQQKDANTSMPQKVEKPKSSSVVQSASEIKLSDEELIIFFKNISKNPSTPEEVVKELSLLLNKNAHEKNMRVKLQNQKCVIEEKSLNVLCLTDIRVESDTDDEDYGFDSVYQLETIHIKSSLEILRVTFIPLAG